MTTSDTPADRAPPGAHAAAYEENAGMEARGPAHTGTLSTHAKLVYMANQIAKFFAIHPEPAAIAGTADHLRKFWDPRMRRLIIEHFDAGGEGLNAITRKAIEQLKTMR
jgi:formate dehydrogenase subunit delta